MLKLKPRKIRTAQGVTSVYYITGTCPVTGERVRASTRCHSRADAEAHLVAFQHRQREKAKYGVEGVATFAEAVVEYLAKGGEARYLEPLVLHLGETALREITDQHLTKGAAKYYPKAKPSTVVRQWYVPFIAVYRAAVKARLAVPREWTRPKVPRRKLPELPSDEWLYTVLKACTKLEQRAALLYMSFSGARASEVVAIKCRDYDPQRRAVILTDTKTGVPRVTALPDLVNDVLALLPRDKPDAPLFGYSSRYSLVRILKRAAERAEVPYYSPHKVGRHSFAKRFLASGNTLRELMDGGGWQSVQAVMLYAHLEQSRVDDAMRSVKTPISGLLKGDKT